MPFQIIRNDITKVKADAIVNTANPHVAVGAGVDSAIYNAAGFEKLLNARKKIGELRPGEVGITEAFALNAKWIIHVNGPVWEGGDRQEKATLRSCYDQALDLAYRKKCSSIAFPLISTGSYGFPKELGLQVAIDAFTAFLEDHDMEIILVVFGAGAVRVSGDLVDEVKSYIDDGYVRGAYRREYRLDRGTFLQRNKEHGETAVLRSFSSQMKPEPEEKSNVYADMCSIPDESDRKEDDDEEPDEADIGKDDDEKPDEADIGKTEARTSHGKKSLDGILKGIYKESFGKHLQMLINKKELKNSGVYAAANISKQYFSKLLKDQVKPSKEKVLALAVGLHLNLDETVDFLRLAGYALSPISQTDKVVEFFIENEDFNVIKINIVLFDYGLSPLSE